MFQGVFWMLDSLIVAELLGYWLHCLLDSDRIPTLSHSHMTHHLLLCGPPQPQRPGREYLDATTGKIPQGNIELEFLLPSGILLSLSLTILWALHVSLMPQAVFVAVTLNWSFLMFGYLHDQMHVDGLWMAQDPWLRLWFRRRGSYSTYITSG